MLAAAIANNLPDQPDLLKCIGIVGAIPPAKLKNLPPRDIASNINQMSLNTMKPSQVAAVAGAVILNLEFKKKRA